MYILGWNADYPDPENFLFMLYGPNGQVKYSGENGSNYANPQYDKLFEEFKAMGNNPARLILINKMLALLADDMPWICAFYPQGFGLYHAWNKAGKVNVMITNGLKYAKINPEMRAQKRLEWNKPLLWPFAIFTLLILTILLPAVFGYRRSENKTAKRFE